MDLAEAYIVQILRRVHHFPVRVLRRSLAIAKRETGSEHPLLGSDIRIFAKSLILCTPERGQRKSMLDLSSGVGTQYAIPTVIDAFGKRITFNRQLIPQQLHPWRRLGQDVDSCPVTVDPDIMSGRLVVAGTRIPVSFIAGTRREGRSAEFISKDYDLPLQTIRQALEHFDTKAA
jgi:uncharacterized protein (DUF433 family)